MAATGATSAIMRGVRVLLPNYRVVMVRPSKELPKNQVTFHIEPRYAWLVRGFRLGERHSF